MALSRQQSAALVDELERRVKFDEWGNPVNRDEVVQYTMQQYGVSKSQAYGYTRKAYRRQHWQRRNEWKKI